MTAPHDQPALGLHTPTPALFEQVYGQLRGIAQQRLAAERSDHTLQATALVHEAWLRLCGGRPIEFAGRAQFFFAAAEAMRRILIDHARAKGRDKRGGQEGKPARRAPHDVLNLAETGNSEEILMLDEALQRLESEDPEAAQVVRLRFYAGLNGDETAAALGVSASSVDREWTYARARLQRLLQE